MNCLKIVFADAFLEEYNNLYNQENDSHKDMLKTIQECRVADYDLLYEWIENYVEEFVGITNEDFRDALLSDIKENLGQHMRGSMGYKGIAKEVMELFEGTYCIDHGTRRLWSTDGKRDYCDECEKKEEEEGDVDCECCEATYTRESCAMAGGKMTCSNCQDECQYSEECKVK